MFIRRIIKYMQSNLFTLLWRRKLSVLLISSSLLLLGLWTWALFNGTYTTTESNGRDKLFFIKEFNSGASNKNEYLIQKLISQANRVLRYQRQQTSDLSASELAALSSSNSAGQSSSASLLLASSLANNNKGNKISNNNKVGSVQFVKFTQNPVSTSLVERRKKSSAGGAALGESFLFEEERLKILQNKQKVQNDDNVMDYERILSSAERQSQYEHELQRMGVPIMAGIGPGGPHPPNERLVHLDLKGAPPKLSFLKRILPILKTLGATGLLIEYEDMFPYTGSLQPLAALNAYKPDELKDFLESVAMHGLTAMPLVQTFGHMEFALKLQGFEHMREIPESPQSICPSQKVSMSFLQDMLTQMIEFHLNVIGDGSYSHENNSQQQSHHSEHRPPASHHHQLHRQAQSLRFSHIHIGCDEVARMGECDKCRQHSRNELFLSHVTAVSSFIRAKWPQLKVVIWDDMLRDMTLSEMQHSHIGNYVEPMIWVYASDVYRFIQPQLWDMYSKVFPTAWGASAFKGAFGESLMIPFLQRHLDNNMRWLAVIAREGGRFSKGFKGLALTGWQRYDHFATLCELLPIGMPSLIVSLATVSKGYFEVDPKENEILKVLECAFHVDSRRSGHPWIELQSQSHYCKLFTTCTYPGSLAYKFALRLYDKQIEVQNYLVHVQEKSAWMSDYNVRHNFSSPLRVHELTANTPSLIDDLSTMAKEAHSVLADVFDDHTIAEFIEQNIYPQIISLRKHIEKAQSLLQRQIWPRRPLPYSRDLVQFDLIPNNNQPDSK